MERTMQTLSLGISPCPNDTYIFGALLGGHLDQHLAELALRIEPSLADVEDLNTKAMNGALDVVKISVAQYPRIAHDYALLHCGGAAGFGCGPVVVARPRVVRTGHDARNTLCNDRLKLAIPGAMTTAALLAGLCGKFPGPRIPLRYDRVMSAVADGTADLGVVIHEGRFTYREHGLEKIFDLGAWWEESTGQPIPLGAIAVRRELDAFAPRLEELVRASLAHARRDEASIWPYIRQHAQEMDKEVIRNHIATFVNDYSHDVGPAREAVKTLVRAAAEATGTALPDKPIFAGESPAR